MPPAQAPRVVLPLILAAALAALPAEAQVQPVALQLDVETPTFELDAGERATTPITVSNRGTLDGTATLSLGTTTDGWEATLSQTQVNVPAGGSVDVTLELTAPAQATTAPDLALTVSGVLTDVTGRFSATATTEVNARFVPPPPPPPPREFPWLATLLAVGLVAAGGAGVTAAAMVRRREGGIEVGVPEAATSARPGYDTYVPAEIRNVSGRPRVAKVSVEGAAPGWIVGTNLGSIPLEANETVSIWVAVRPPLDAPLGAAEVRLVARPAEAKRKAEGVPVRVSVVRDGVPEQPGRTLSEPIHHRSGRLGP